MPDSPDVILAVAKVIAKSHDQRAEWDMHWAEESRTQFLADAEVAIRAYEDAKSRERSTT